MKKIVALLLVAVMVLSCLPVLAGSKTAQTKDKINKNITAEFTLDKNTFTLSDDYQEIKVDCTMNGGSSGHYNGGLYADYTYTRSEKGEKKTVTETIFCASFEEGKDKVQTWYLGNYSFRREGTIKLYVTGTDLANFKEEKYYDEEEDYGYTDYVYDEKDNFYCEGPTITVVNDISKPQVDLSLTSSKEILTPGEEFEISYSFSNAPESIKYSMVAFATYVVDGDKKTKYETVTASDYKGVLNGKATLTAPTFGHAVEIRASWNIWDEELIYDIYSRYDEDCDTFLYIQEKPPKTEDLEFSLPEINKFHLKKTASENTPLQIKVTCKDPTSTLPQFTWTPDIEGIVSVSADGVITPVAVGETMVRGKAQVGENTYEHAFCVIVEKNTTPVTKVKPSKKKLTLKKGKTAQINLTFTPATAFDTSVKWKTSDKKVATVKNGKITAKGKGKCVITVTMKDKKSTATCNIKVTVK